MPQACTRRGSPDVFDFEGTGDEARAWLDLAFGAQMRMTGPFGAVRHHRDDHGSVTFDHVEVEACFTFDSDAMPALVVVDVIGGKIEYSRDQVTDRIHDGDTVLASGWDMPFSGRSEGYEIRTTNISATAMSAAVEEVDPDREGPEVAFTSFAPRSASAAAQWRATVDQLSATFPAEVDVLAHAEASRLLVHTLLRTFPNDLVDSSDRMSDPRDQRDASPSAVRRALRIIEERAGDDLSMAELARLTSVSARALQYAFRKELGCTPHDYLRRVRLDLAHQALRGGTATSVTDVAMKFGFHNPGRFASYYRQVFDENPRQTFARGSS